MARPRLSVVIPTRGRAHTLGFTLKTCVAQEFPDCEFLVSDNSGGDAVRATLGRFDDRRLRCVRTPKLLAMADSWEFAVGQAAGEYVTVIGDDDGLLLHALPEIDRILRLVRAPVLRWESVCYNWPDLPPQPHATPNELLVPLTKTGGRHSIQALEARPMMLRAAHSEISYAQLPMIYCSAVHQSLLARLRERTGRVFRAQCPDVYSAFAFASLAGYYHSCTAPMGVSGLSGASNGVAELYLGGRSPVAEEFRRLNAEADLGPHPRVPDLPLMAAKVGDAFQRAKDALFAGDARLRLDRKAVVLKCLEELRGAGTDGWTDAAAAIREALGDDPALVAWFEATCGRGPRATGSPGARRTRRGYAGPYLLLDAAGFGVSDVYEAVVLCEKLLGYRAEGANARLASEAAAEPPAPEAGPAVAPAAAASPPARDDGPALYEQELDLSLLLRLSERLPERTVLDVGAERGAFVDAFLAAGCPRVFAFEPFPSHAELLRDRFASDDRVRVLEVALGARDEKADLHIAEDRGGREYPYYHSLVAFAETEQVRWAKRVPVVCRSLDSLVEDGTLPAEVGVLKVDTEGHDLEVIRGMGRLSAAVIMVEYWDTIPEIFGACPYTLEEMAQALAPRGYSNAIVVKRHDVFQVLQFGSLATRPGDWGNAIFVHDRVWPALAPLVHEVTSKVQTQLIDAAVEMRQRASHRRQVIAEMKAQQQLPRGMARWLKPRLGHLRHHPPRPMEIPARYRAEPPVTDGPVMSIVTPTLNSERFVERTIQSVLHQGYAPLEYVVKDGGSSDATQAILERYRDRLGGVEVGKDSGQADGINRGFARTSGEIMAYLNSDDLLLPGTLAYVARFFVTHPKVDVVYGHRVLIDENDLEIGRWVLPRHESDILSWTDYVPQETLFWRRRIWERIGGMLDDTFAFAMDWDLLLRLRDAGARFVRLPRFLGAFRVHEGQKTSSQMRDVGAREIARLRLRVHGRPVSPAEVRRRTRGYLVRHIMYQKLYRLGLLRY